ncbi:MAG TPA: hypothetical protein VI796_02965 [Candidatus Thermoplasmatota archaeon]|nr:hypothetical protein [Candidatus Thermoplasmatota archaeon]
MKTYLKVTFHSEGAKPSAVQKALAGLGFRPVKGAYDFAYDWPGKASVEDVLRFGDKIHAELSGLDCMFEMETA